MPTRREVLSGAIGAFGAVAAGGIGAVATGAIGAVGAGAIPASFPTASPVQVTSGPVYDVGLPNGYDDTAAVTAAYNACPPGGRLQFDTGEYFIDPLPLAKQVSIVGRGPWNSKLTPRTAITGNFLDYNLPATSASIWQYYGPVVAGIGLNLYGAPKCTGLRLGAYASWARVEDCVALGGGVSLSNAGANNRVVRCDFFDAGVFIHVDADTGLELRLRDLQLGRNTPGETLRCIEVVAATWSPNKGALYMDNVAQSGGGSNSIRVDAGLYMAAPAPAAGAPACSMPLFAKGCVLDNVTGGGPGIEFAHVSDVNFSLGWVNSGAASGGPAVRITGGSRLRFIGNQYFGGAAGGTAKTYDFVAGGGGTSTRGVVSLGNICPTNWVYYLPPAGGPSDLQLDDYLPGAPAGFPISNDMAQLAAARAPRFNS